ncbi:TonB-linked outer membrane protein, SusC/RagA family [Catalinimonas alkaloidigena]|uniref:TonB-linked outer membrane protein, SusC/RagA family n=1 Tax=Catalinimonas alkaloidigena TaxID=1075417 RepID=A0A1G9G8U9_9BACT|nr:TonB-dependent receptor [Catalinimonas alkaloidigena]SDK96985.1 TonB-linked outer membrane protein, SusC/RagA family [Catalinimonas alkaloidigena]
MKYFFTFLVTCLLPLSVALAQTKTISGRVTTAEDGEGLPGANVIVEGTSKGTTTDIEGNYSITLTPEENTLVFSFIGFQTQTIPVGNQSTIDVVMQTDAQTLEDVVVIGYGTVNKSDLTGSVSSVRGEDLTKVPAVSPTQALQGKVSGVQVTSTNGAPGSGTVVRIRGTGTFNNASPIYVVDGVILDNIDYLNSADIESMEVLKDASATAIYGSRGANGVVIVTTRQGARGQEGTTFNVTGEFSMQRMQRPIDLLNGPEFATVVNEIKPGTYNNVSAVPSTDWQDLLFRDAPIHNYQVSASGSTQKMQYYFGLGYFNQQGIIPKSSYERVTLKFNNTYNLADWARIGSNLSFTPYRQQNTRGNSPFVAYRSQPVVTPYQADGSYSVVPGVGNFLADIEYNNSFERGIRTVDNIYGELDLLEGLTLRTSFGVDMQYTKTESFTPVFFVSPQQQNDLNDLNKSYSDRVSWLWENTLNYRKELGRHRINAVVGYTMQESSSERFAAAGQDILRNDPDFWYLNPNNIVSTSIENTVDLSQNYAIMSYLARANYTFDNRYLFTATFRRDGSSKFSDNNRWGNFPSFAVGWNVINEAFMQEVPMLSNLKVRGSWGIIGNEKIDYNRQYSRVENGLAAVFGRGDMMYPGSTFGETGNPDLSWENTYQTDIGMEFGLFSNRLNVEVDYYNKRTEGILINLPVPGYLGNGDGATITYNAAEVLNRGFEYNVVWSGAANEFTYRIGTVGTTIHNEALKVFGTGGSGDRLFNGGITTATGPGLPLGAFYGYQVDGVFQTQEELNAYPHLSTAGVGDLRFVDTNADGVLNSDDRTYLGSPIPSFIYGLNMEFGWKGFDLTADFQGQTGNKIYNIKETVRPDLYNFEQHVINRWTGPGTSNTEPRATAGGYNWLPSSYFVQDGSYLRLRTLTLGYTLPEAIAQQAKMRSARVYLRGTNVFTLTKFTGYSPEVASSSSIDNGIDSGGNDSYPVSSIYSVGLNVTF